jgi:hypothetical protein
MDTISDLPTAFAVWAAVVGMIGIAIVWELARLRAELKDMTSKLNDYVVVMERRVTHIESHMQIMNVNFKPAEF